MQDSLEDYIRIVRNTKNSEELPKQVNKKDVLVAAHVKKECDTKALQIVEFSIEGKLRSQVFLKCLPFINQQHYQDIVEERAVTKLCGYPICGKKIPDMPKKQFHISTKNNKIYDITERKNFCSNFCYKASSHIKKQIDDTPLWHRKCDQSPRFNLLEKTERGIPGVEVDQGIVRAVPDISSFTSISSFTHISLDEIEENELNPEEAEISDIEVKKYKRIPKHHHHKSSMKTINENEEDVPDDKIDSAVSSRNKSPVIETIPEEVDENQEPPARPNPKPSLKLIEVNPAKIIKTSLNRNNKLHKGSEDIEDKISKCFREWITLETFVYIYGENKVKAVMNNEKLGDMFESLRISELEVHQQKRYLEICRKLHLRELAEDKFEKSVVGSDNQFKPLPDYRQLKEEGKFLDLKVKSFYSGVLSTDSGSSSNLKKTIEEETEEAPAVLPLMDVNSQNALRRKIFLTSLKRPMQRLLDNLEIEENTIISDVQSLVKTFCLKADNIVFKPSAWPILSILLIKIMCLKDAELHQILEKDSSKEILNSTLDSLPNKGVFIEDLLDLVQDVDKFIGIYICN